LSEKPESKKKDQRPSRYSFGICVFGEDLLSGNGFDETLSQYKRIGLSPLQTTERE
jgi:hypothetical protein